MNLRKSLLLTGLASALAVGLTSSAFAATWETFVIRNASDGSSPAIQDNTAYGTPAKEFVISKGSQKAGWGTSSLDGCKVGDITSISISRLDDTKRFAAGSGPARGPYINMWITDNSGHFAVIANEPSNPEWAPGQQWNMTWDDLKTKTAKIYETNNLSWLPTGSLTFANFAGYTILAPSAAYIAAGNGVTPGAPRELGTNDAYGFNWVFGDTLSNYVTGAEGYVVADPKVRCNGSQEVPEPMSVLLGIMGLAPVAAYARRMKKS